MPDTDKKISHSVLTKAIDVREKVKALKGHSRSSQKSNEINIILNELNFLIPDLMKLQDALAPDGVAELVAAVEELSMARAAFMALVEVEMDLSIKGNVWAEYKVFEHAADTLETALANVKGGV